MLVSLIYDGEESPLQVTIWFPYVITILARCNCMFSCAVVVTLIVSNIRCLRTDHYFFYGKIGNFQKKNIPAQQNLLKKMCHGNHGGKMECPFYWPGSSHPYKKNSCTT